MTGEEPGGREILSVAQMYAADAATIAGGVPGYRLMHNAGAAITREIRRRFVPAATVVLCGPGNNGGDGFVVARLLAAAGWPVRLALLGSRESLRGDAARAADDWRGPVEDLRPEILRGAGIVVDALFGAGLQRPLEGVVRATVEALGRSPARVVAVDVPSGIHGDSGQVMGAGVRADLTVTFCRCKPGHLLLPGRMHCGTLVVADIGIPDEVVGGLGVTQRVNDPDAWLAHLPRRTPLSHKYVHGHAVVVGGGADSSGAARLAARSALRAGAGLVTVACTPGALPVYAAHMTAVMVRPFADGSGFEAILADPRKNAFLLGPGGGVGAETRTLVGHALAAGKLCVLDADALTSFADDPAGLFERIESPCVLTPHEGEYASLFRHEGDKLARARLAAEESGAVVILKGGDTVVAAPDGRVVIQASAPAALATAGSGDVLAGIVLGLVAQGMPAFEAAAAAVWIHAEAAANSTAGMISEDLVEELPSVLAGLTRTDIDRLPPGPATG
jgi:NAD(P)H-hydrate epimerase